MKKKIWSVGIVICIVIIIMIWGYYDLKKDTTPLYIPGRDTIEEWDEGKCEIVGSDVRNELRFNNQTISSHNNYVMAYREVGSTVFFLMTNGKIVVNLESDTYDVYENTEMVKKEYADTFLHLDSFTWLSDNRF